MGRQERGGKWNISVGGLKIGECTGNFLGWSKTGDIEMERQSEEADAKVQRPVHPPAMARGEIGTLAGSSGCSRGKEVCLFRLKANPGLLRTQITKDSISPKIIREAGRCLIRH